MALPHHSVIAAAASVLPAYLHPNDCQIVVWGYKLKATVAHNNNVLGYVPVRRALPHMPADTPLADLEREIQQAGYRISFVLGKRAKCEITAAPDDVIGIADSKYIAGETASQCRERMLRAAYKDATATYIADSPTQG